jgi:hypothetical protein
MGKGCALAAARPCVLACICAMSSCSICGRTEHARERLRAVLAAANFLNAQLCGRFNPGSWLQHNADEKRPDNIPPDARHLPSSQQYPSRNTLLWKDGSSARR